MVLKRPAQLLQSRDLRMILHTMRKVKRLLRHSEEDANEKESIINTLFEGEGSMKRNEYIGIMASLMVTKEPEKVQLVRDLFTSCDYQCLL